MFIGINIIKYLTLIEALIFENLTVHFRIFLKLIITKKIVSGIINSISLKLESLKIL